jgi:hypothetical protein
MVMTTIQAEVTVTADDSDALVNTDLAYAPGPGAVGIWLASTVADSRATVNVGGKVVMNDSIIGKVATDAQIDMQAESPLIVPVKGGEKIRVNLDEVSAATIRCRAVHMGV